MKYIILVLVFPAALACCNNPEKETAADGPAKITHIAASSNSDAFNQSFETLLLAYYRLKDACVEADTANINAASGPVALAAGHVAVDSVKHDSLASARQYIQAISTAAGKIAGEPDMVQKRKGFQAVSDALYSLVKAVHYDRQTIYHQHCPMAFNEEEEAYWLSNTSTVMNPYLGKKHPKYKAAMVSCGNVADSLGGYHPRL